MKKIIIVLILIHCLFQFAEGQWLQQVSPVNQHLTKVKFVNSKTGWITTYSGSIMKTTNSGENWIVQYSNPGKQMYGLSIVDTNIVYAVGWFETIVKTTNGGSNWIEIKNGPFGEGHSYEAVYFINKETGWVSGSGNLIFKTTNGGMAFDSIIVLGQFRDFYFRNNKEGLVCGEGGYMYKTDNGGLNWHEIFVPVANQSADFNNLTFVNNDTGYTQGTQNGKVYKTTNFGLTWDSLTRIPESINMISIFFSSVNTGWTCGQNNKIFKTTDAGLNWRRENTSSFSPYGFASIYFLNDSIGWCVGTLGKIAYTTSSGMTGVSNSTMHLLNDFSLKNNYPNPFNSSTIIKFNIEKNSNYKLEIFNNLGQLIETIFNEYKSKGNYEIVFNADKIPSGNYFYKLSNGKESQLKKFLLIK